MARFWTAKKNMITGDHKNSVHFNNGTYETDDSDIIKMLREKAKIRALEIVEVTPKDEEAAEKSDAIAPVKSKK